MSIAPIIPHRAQIISDIFQKEKLRAFKKITVSTHSLTTLANARIESIHSCHDVTILSTVLLIFFQIFLKFAFDQTKNWVIIAHAMSIRIHSYNFSVAPLNHQNIFWKRYANKKLIIIQATIPRLIYLLRFFWTQNTLNIENIRPIIIAASKVSRNVTINISI